MKEEKIWELIVLKLSGEATPAQVAELEQALQQDPDVGFSLSILERLWKNKQHKPLPHTADRFNRHLQRLSNHLSEEPLKYEEVIQRTAAPSRRRIFYKRAALVSAIAACFILGLVILWNNSRQHAVAPLAVAENLVTTRNGSKSKLQLPDGTTVWLNAGSKITYGNDFTGAARKVALEGEAFFEVAKHANAPFIIHTNMVEIKVLGTALNVRAYANEKVTETALIRGAVEITLYRSPEKKIVLRPDEKLVVKNDSSVVTGHKPVPIMTLTQVHYWDQEHDDTPVETLWTKSKLVFDDETLEQVALKLERWYGVKVTIQGEQLKEIAYSGMFEDEDITEVLYALHLTGNFHYTIRKKEVIIGP